MSTDLHEDLRAWAKGLYPLEAATELLIRGGWAQVGRPWVKERDHGGHWIDFECIPKHIGAFSGGEQRFLMLAASLGAADFDGSTRVSLEDGVSGLDRDKVRLLLAAIAHAAGTHEGRSIIVNDDTRTASFGPEHESLYPWPEGGA